jgi:hypothetical protein
MLGYVTKQRNEDHYRVAVHTVSDDDLTAGQEFYATNSAAAGVKGKKPLNPTSLVQVRLCNHAPSVPLRNRRHDVYWYFLLPTLACGSVIAHNAPCTYEAVISLSSPLQCYASLLAAVVHVHAALMHGLQSTPATTLVVFAVHACHVHNMCAAVTF